MSFHGLKPLKLGMNIEWDKLELNLTYEQFSLSLAQAPIMLDELSLSLTQHRQAKLTFVTISKLQKKNLSFVS